MTVVFTRAIKTLTKTIRVISVTVTSENHFFVLGECSIYFSSEAVNCCQVWLSHCGTQNIRRYSFHSLHRLTCILSLFFPLLSSLGFRNYEVSGSPYIWKWAEAGVWKDFWQLDKSLHSTGTCETVKRSHFSYLWQRDYGFSLTCTYAIAFQTPYWL